MHVKFDSGMGRLGTRDPAEASRVAGVARAMPGMVLADVMAASTADDLKDDGFFASTARRVHTLGARGQGRGPCDRRPRGQQRGDPCATSRLSSTWSAAGSASTAWTRSAEPRRQGAGAGVEVGSYVAEVKLCRAGQSAGYGRQFVAEGNTFIGVLPIGYGDGWRRGLSNNADVLIGGHRHPLVGTVSMDSITVDLGLRRRTGTAARPPGDPDRLPGEVSGLPPRRWPGAWTRSTTRSPVR